MLQTLSIHTTVKDPSSRFVSVPADEVDDDDQKAIASAVVLYGFVMSWHGFHLF